MPKWGAPFRSTEKKSSWPSGPQANRGCNSLSNRSDRCPNVACQVRAPDSRSTVPTRSCPRSSVMNAARLPSGLGKNWVYASLDTGRIGMLGPRERPALRMALRSWKGGNKAAYPSGA